MTARADALFDVGGFAIPGTEQRVHIGQGRSIFGPIHEIVGHKSVVPAEMSENWIGPFSPMNR